MGQSWPGFGGLAVSLSVAVLAPLPFVISGFSHRFGDPSKDVAGLALGLLVPLAPYLLEFWALRRLPTRVFGVLMSIEPGIGALLGLLILGQSLALGGRAGDRADRRREPRRDVERARRRARAAGRRLTQRLERVSSVALAAGTCTT